MQNYSIIHQHLKQSYRNGMTSTRSVPVWGSWNTLACERVTHVAWVLKVHLEEMAWHALHLLCYLAAWFDKIFERGEN